MNFYVKSSLSRYLEEALAETAAQVQVRGGLGSVIEGLRFPVRNGYVILLRAEGPGGQGVLTEAGGLTGIGSAAGLSFSIWFRQAPSSSVQPARRAVAR